MKENRMKNALESIARHAVPEDVNLMPNIVTRLERKSFMVTLRARPALLIFLVLLVLALLTGVAYAIGKATGYIPGIGLINQSSPLRVLAEPVSITRAGITLTIEQVVLSVDKTVVVYQVEGIPEDAYARPESSGEGENSVSSVVAVPVEGTPAEPQTSIERNDICIADEHLALPNGTILSLRNSTMNGLSAGFEKRVSFTAIPAEVNEVTFLVSCVFGTVPGKLPESWEIPLRFVSAPPDMTILPVVDVATPAADGSQAALTLEKVIETEDGYILIGKFRSIGLPLHAKANRPPNQITITDANKQTIEARRPTSLDLVSNTYGEFYWAYEIQGKQHAFPLTFTLNTVSADIPGQSDEFELDTGSDLKIGQVWNVKKDLEIAGYTIQIVSIERIEKGYSFVFKADPDMTVVSVEINHMPFSSASGGNDRYGKGNLFYSIEYDGDVPSGKLMIQLNGLQAHIHGLWQVQWSPGVVLPAP